MRAFLTTVKRKAMLTAERAWSSLEIGAEGVSEKDEQMQEGRIKTLGTNNSFGREREDMQLRGSSGA